MQGKRVERVALELDRFAGEALAEEARRLGASVEQLAKFAVLYYLADLDSGRIARAPAEHEHLPPHGTPAQGRLSLVPMQTRKDVPAGADPATGGSILRGLPEVEI